MDWFSDELVEQLIRMPYLAALGVICWVFYRIIVKLIEKIK